MTNLRDILLIIIGEYESQRLIHGGCSTSRLATKLVNQGRFFERLKNGSTCTLPTFERVSSYFAKREHWPANSIPQIAHEALIQIGVLP
jgi:hypothetical protein